MLRERSVLLDIQPYELTPVLPTEPSEGCTPPLPDRRLVINRHITHPKRGDVKQKHFSSALRKTSMGACIQALLLRGEEFGSNAWSATEYDRDTDRSCWSPLSGFMQRSRHHSLRSCASQPLA